MPSIFTYIIISLLLLWAEWCYCRVARKYHIFDKATERSSHCVTTIRGGGIIIPVAIWLYTIFFGTFHIGFIIALTLLAMVSFIDDIRPLSITLRIVVQMVATVSMLCVSNVEWGNCLYWLPIVTIVGVGIINAFNFMDGINGITAAYSMAVIAPLMYLNHHTPFIDTSLLIVTAIAIVVFALFNFRKDAVCFAGDVGSVSIAFIILFVLWQLIHRTGDVTYVMLLSVYGVDVILTIIHRIILRENITQPHRKHLYQIMANELHIPHRSVALIYASLQLFISAAFILLPVNHWIYSGVVLAALCVAYVVCIKKYYYLHSK